MLARGLSGSALLVTGCLFFGCSTGATEQASAGTTSGAGSTTSAAGDQGQLAVDASTPPSAAVVAGDGGAAISQDPMGTSPVGTSPMGTSPMGTAPSSTSSTGAGNMAADDAGTNDAAGADSQVPPPPGDCDFADGGCVSQCGAQHQSTVCAVVTPDSLCELQGFVGTSAQVACGQAAIIGTACCGECGCVPVEVFFDGTYCWEGVPTCTVNGLTDQYLDPHAPGALDAGWDPADANGIPGTFSLGTPPDSGSLSPENTDSDDDGGATGTGSATDDTDAGPADAGTDAATANTDATAGS